jgi:uncharacterized protein DUF1573
VIRGYLLVVGVRLNEGQRPHAAVLTKYGRQKAIIHIANVFYFHVFYFHVFYFHVSYFHVSYFHVSYFHVLTRPHLAVYCRRTMVGFTAMGAVMVGESNDTAGSVVAHREWPRYFFFFFAVICSIGAVACAIATRPDPPEVLTVDATYKDLGLVRQMDTPEASFRLTNHTSSGIEIKRVVSSCRCTTPEVDDRKLGRGESSQLHAALKIGTARKGVRAHIDVLYVREDEEKLRRLSLTVSAKVEPHYEATPDTLRFGPQQPRQQQVVITSNYDPAVSIRVVLHSSGIPGEDD